MGEALIFGAGNIGRGFLAVLLRQAGYAVTFVDVDETRIALLNKERSYPVYVCSAGGISEQMVENVRGISIKDTHSLTSAICRADLILTAVGKIALSAVAETLAIGLMERARRRPSSGLALVVIACENVQDNTSYLASLIRRATPIEYQRKLSGVSFPDCIVDRIVPSILPDAAHTHPLAVAVEDYYQFTVSATQLRTAFPTIPGVELSTDVEARLEQKLFTLNMAHGIVGYYGAIKRLEFVHEAVIDPDIRQLLLGALREVGGLLVRRHRSITEETQQKYAERIVERFENPYLRDTLTRVASQPARKLAKDERLLRPAHLIWRSGKIPAHLAAGIACGFHFKNPHDSQSTKLSADIDTYGIDIVLQSVSGLAPNRALSNLIRANYLLRAI